MSGSTHVRLRDGTSLLVRPIATSDSDDLAEAFRAWSPDSRYRRFFAGVSELTSSSLRYLTDVDHHDHEALVAFDEETGRGVGVVRFIRDREDPTRAEMAVSVADDWQGRGVGTTLLSLLADRAREEDISCFTASVLAANTPMLDVLSELGEPHVVRRDAGVVELEVPLPDEGIGRQLPALLRTAATDALEH